MDEESRLLGAGNGQQWIKMPLTRAAHGPEMQVLSAIESLDKGEGCYAKVRYLAPLVGLAPGSVSRSITKLKSRRLISQIPSKAGRKSKTYRVNRREIMTLEMQSLEQLPEHLCDRFLRLPLAKLNKCSWYERLTIGAIINAWLIPIDDPDSDNRRCKGEAEGFVYFRDCRDLTDATGLPPNRSTDIWSSLSSLDYRGLIQAEALSEPIIISDVLP